MRNSRRRFLKTAVSTLTAGTALLRSADERPTREEIAAMDGVVTAFLQAHDIPGMSVAVGHEAQLLHAKGYGMADRDRGEKVTPAHLFRIASVSKPITSVAIYQLIEQGKLRLDDPVFGPGSILGEDFGAPPYQPHVAGIHLRHLLTHTAGGWRNDGNDPMFRDRAMDHRQLIAWTLAHAPLTNPPGEKYAYSNFGFCVVGRIVEKVTGRPYEQHVHEAVLRRCGVDDMRIAGNTLAERVPGEVVYYGGNPYDMNVRRMDSHGGWLATATDLFRFASHLDILQPNSIAAMTTGTTANPQYASGWAVNKVPNWWHTGSLPGTTTILVRTASGFRWAALLNARESNGDTGGELDRMMWQMVRAVKSWKA
jgi:CubicO group peptidase (beta-lactamase class C family)